MPKGCTWCLHAHYGLPYVEASVGFLKRCERVAALPVLLFVFGAAMRDARSSPTAELKREKGKKKKEKFESYQILERSSKSI